MLCFRKLLVANKIMDKRGRGGIKIFRRKFFVLQCRTLSQGNRSVLCFSKIQVAKNSMDRKRGYLIFPSDAFCLTVPNSFVGEPFRAVFQKNSATEKDFG